MTEEKDIPHVMEIIHMAQEQFCRMGIDQWQDGYPNEEVIRRDMNRRESYVAEKEGTVIGTAAISMEKEENYEISGELTVSGQDGENTIQIQGSAQTDQEGLVSYLNISNMQEIAEAVQS